ncbi:MAG: cell division protein PerM [Trebonia sp.]
MGIVHLPTRPMLMAGGVAALAAAGGGLAVLATLTLIGWITAPHVGLGGGLAGALRSAGLLWLVAHHVEVTVHGVGRIGLLPLGLVLLPAVLIERAGRWMTREGHVAGLLEVGPAAMSIALPYALFTGAVAVASRTSVAAPSLWQAVMMGFLIALLASGFGAARSLAPWRKLAIRVPPRPRSVILGMLAALAVLTVCGALLDAISLIVHLGAYKEAVSQLNPGIFGSVLLLLASLCYLPNSVIWAVAYMLGPGFAFGIGTAVSPSGSALGAVPSFPMLAALPVGPTAAFPAWLGFFVLVMPYLAGALAGLMTVRIAPTPSFEAAPFWGLVTGTLTAVVIGFCAKFSGGPLGAGRLASVGPAGGEVGLVAVLEVGVTAALVAGAANWLIIRHHIRRLNARQSDEPASRETSRPQAGRAERADRAERGAPLAARVSAPLPVLIVDETDDAGGHRIHVDPWAARDEE